MRRVPTVGITMEKTRFADRGNVGTVGVSSQIAVSVMIEIYRYSCPKGHVNIKPRSTSNTWYCDTCKTAFAERRDLKHE